MEGRDRWRLAHDGETMKDAVIMVVSTGEQEEKERDGSSDWEWEKGRGVHGLNSGAG